MAPRAGAVVLAEVVAHRITDLEVLGLIPAAAGSWPFFSSLYPIFQTVVRPLSGPSWRFYLS